MDDHARPASKRQLELLEARARIAKLEAETRAVSIQLTPKYQARETLKVITSLGGVIAALAAIAGFMFSFFQWSYQTSEAHRVRIEERLDRALAKMAAVAPSERVGGIASITSFLVSGTEDQKRQVLVALTHFLATEFDPSVRAAIAEVFLSIQRYGIEPPVLNEALSALATTSRVIVKRGNLGSRLVKSIESDIQIAQSVGFAIVKLLRAGAQTSDLHGIYCAHCDFSGLSLVATNFDGAILVWASFREARLDGSSFKSADLGGTEFFGADLRNADFTSDLYRHHDNIPTQVADAIWGDLTELRSVSMPSFRCANLTNARFTERTLFGLSDLDKDHIDPHSLYATDFVGAILNGADFEGIRIYVIQKTLASPLPFTAAGWIERVGVPKDTRGRPYFVRHVFFRPQSELIAKDDRFATNLAMVAYAFANSDWQNAKFPKVLKDIIQKFPITNPVQNFCKPFVK